MISCYTYTCSGPPHVAPGENPRLITSHPTVTVFSGLLGIYAFLAFGMGGEGGHSFFRGGGGGGVVFKKNLGGGGNSKLIL